VLKVVEPNGQVSGAGRRAWFRPGKFRFCPSCGDYSVGGGRDINRLTGLTAEGRSSATTILVSSIHQVDEWARRCRNSGTPP
jgi:hypothetical protein